MPLSDQKHTVRLPLPDMLVRARDTVIQAPVYLDGTTAVTPSSWSVTVYDGSNTSRATASGSSSAASTTIAAASVPATLALASDWRVEWVITLSGGTVLTPRNDAALVRSGLWPVIGDVDLARRVPSLTAGASNSITTASDFQDYLDEAWTEINLRLIAKGNRPNLIMEPSALRSVHLYLALALIFEDQQTRLNEAWSLHAQSYRAEYQRAWDELNPRYATGDEEQADTRRRAMQPTVWLNGPGSRWPW